MNKEKEKIDLSVWDIVRRLEEIDKKLEEHYIRNTTIDHLYHAWTQSRWFLDYNTKTLFIVCNNDTKFSKDYYEEEKEYITKDGWTIVLYVRHSRNNLVCVGYCSVI